MIILGIILLIAGFLLKISILWTWASSRSSSARSWRSWAAPDAPSAAVATTSDVRRRSARHRVVATRHRLTFASPRTGYSTHVREEYAMPIWEWILIAAIAVVVVVAAVVAVSMISFRTKTKRLKQHYGAEYERVVDETGSEKGAVRELTTRERKRDKLDIVPLTPSALSEFTARWREVQAGFVDNPATAVGVADRLVTEVMRRTGLSRRRFRPAGRRHLGRPPADRRQLPGGARHPRLGAACQHRATARGVRALPGAVREVARNPDRQRRITGGKRMTTHEEHTLTDSHDDPAPDVSEPPPARRRKRGRNVEGTGSEHIRYPPPRSVERAAESDTRIVIRGTFFSPATSSPTCARGGPAFRRRSSTIRRIASTRRTVWSPTWSSSSPTGFSDARSRLEEQWSRGEEASTEDLRLALMHYREFFERLLAV